MSKEQKAEIKRLRVLLAEKTAECDDKDAESVAGWNATRAVVAAGDAMREQLPDGLEVSQAWIESTKYLRSSPRCGYQWGETPAECAHACNLGVGHVGPHRCCGIEYTPTDARNNTTAFEVSRVPEVREYIREQAFRAVHASDADDLLKLWLAYVDQMRLACSGGLLAIADLTRRHLNVEEGD